MMKAALALLRRLIGEGPAECRRVVAHLVAKMRGGARRASEFARSVAMGFEEIGRGLAMVEEAGTLLRQGVALLRQAAALLRSPRPAQAT